jgi:hypothetical protein
MCLDRAAKCAWRTIFERKLGSPHRQATGGQASGAQAFPMNSLAPAICHRNDGGAEKSPWHVHVQQVEHLRT